jgi:hypothetical protein
VEISKKYFLFYIGLFVLGNWVAFINSGIFWDDWALYNTSNLAIDQQFIGNGAPLFGEIHKILQSTSNPAIVYNLLTALLQVGSIYLLFKIFILLGLRGDFYYQVIVVAGIIPFFAAKNTMICFPYTLGYFIFALGCYLMFYHDKKNNFFLRIASIISFLLSFTVNSFVVFYIVPLFIVFYGTINRTAIKKHSYSETITLLFNSVLNFIKNKIDFILLPFIFYIIKKSFLQPTGLYAEGGYNQLTISGLLKAPEYLFDTFVSSLVGLFGEVYTRIFESGHFSLIAIFIMTGSIFAYLIFRNNYYQGSIDHKKSMLPFYTINLLSGILVFSIAALPYCLVNKLPSFIGYSTRHQLTLPLGAALIIMSLLRILFKAKFYNYSFVVVAILFTSTSLSQNLKYATGWFKQEALINFFSYSEFVKENHTILILDNTENLDATSREYSFYALNGMCKLALGDQQRFIAEAHEYFKYKDRLESLMHESAKFNMSDYKITLPNAILVINIGDINLESSRVFLKALFYYYFSKDQFRYLAKNFLDIKMDILDYSKIKILFDNKE